MEESDKLCGERSGAKGQSVPWLSPDIINILVVSHRPGEARRPGPGPGPDQVGGGGVDPGAGAGDLSAADHGEDW